MKKSRNFLSLIAILIFFSCHKKDFKKSLAAEESDFYFNATIAGEPVSLKAGTDNYYMYASYQRDNNYTYNLIADLKPRGCAGCKNSLQVLIYDFKYSFSNEAIEIDSSLTVRSYPLLGAPLYAVQFKSQYNQTAISYLWNFGDNKKSSEENPLHLYSTAGNYSVSLKINSTQGCQQYISNIEKISYPAFNTKISSVNLSATALNFSALSTGFFKSYLWSFGDGDTSLLPSPSHTYKVAGTYPVTLRTVDSNNDTVFSRYNTATQTTPMPCLTNYSIESITKVQVTDPFSSVVINWTDENGELFTSYNPGQPGTSSFKIISVEDFDVNEKNEQTKRIRINFSCEVYNGSRVKLISNAEAVLCVSYK